MIPQEEIAPGATQALVEWLHDEIHRALGERRPLEEDWQRYHEVYKAKPEHKVKSFPFHGASNLVIPVAATDVDIIFARLMGVLFAPDHVFATRALQPEKIEFARVLQEFLQSIQYKELDTYNVFADWVMEIVKLGTGILKTRYKRETKTVFEYREVGGQVNSGSREVRIHDHPEFSHVSLFDFLVPPDAKDVQTASWCAERVLLTRQQYLNRVRAGIYLPVPRLDTWSANSRGSHIEENLMRLDNYVQGAGNKFEFWETWTNFDINGSGSPRAILVTLHLPTWSVVRLDYNPYLLQEYPYDRARFLRQEKRFYGIGLIEMDDQFQDEVSAMHNQRIDSGTIANSTMFKGRKGVIKEDEPVFPGRWFLLDDMNDVDVMNMGSGKFDSSTGYEAVTMDYAKRRTGVNEHIAGQFAPSIGYATAHTNIQQLQQATQRFDQTLREIREAAGSGAMKAVELIQQFDRPGRAYDVLGQRDGEILEGFIAFPIEEIRNGVAIELTATSAALNKEVEIRTNTILMQMVTQFYREVLDGMMLAMTPNLPPQIQALIFQMIQGGTVLMRRILDAHGVQDTNDLVPEINQILSGGMPIGQLTSTPVFAGQGGPPGINAPPGLPGIAQGGGGAPGGIQDGNGEFGVMGQDMPPSGGFGF